MGLRGWLNRLERGASGDMDSFRLRDDTPEIYRKLAEAKNPAGALAQLEEQLTPGNPEMRFVQPSELFDIRALVPHEDLLSG